MNKQELETALALHRDWLAGKEGGERLVMIGKDLSRSDLSRSDLSGSNLSWSDLSWSDLSGSDLSGSNLSGSDLSRSDLSGSDLSRSNLYGYAQISFSGHGECGRMLVVIRQTAESELYFCCGCFRGSEKDLKDYIKNGEERFKASRTLAMKTAIKLIAVKKGEA